MAHPIETIRALAGDLGVSMDARALASALDARDELRRFRREFHIPRRPVAAGGSAAGGSVGAGGCSGDGADADVAGAGAGADAGSAADAGTDDVGTAADAGTDDAGTDAGTAGTADAADAGTAGTADADTAGTAGTADEALYLCGNSLGLQPRRTAAMLGDDLADWRALGVEGHFHGKRRWVDVETRVQAGLVEVLGARFDHEVTAMNSLTVNVHLMMVRGFFFFFFFAGLYFFFFFFSVLADAKL
jgi:hypothetical protein